MRKISRVLGIPTSSVQYTIKKLNISRPYITKISRKEIIKCFKLGMTPMEISKKYNCAYANCCRKHKKWREGKF